MYLGDLSSPSERFYHPPKVHEDVVIYIIRINHDCCIFLLMMLMRSLSLDEFQPFTKVVVAKYPMGSMAVADMLELGKPFGTIVKHLIFPFKVIIHKGIIIDVKKKIYIYINS